MESYNQDSICGRGGIYEDMKYNVSSFPIELAAKKEGMRD
jgi:hypothetical protein